MKSSFSFPCGLELGRYVAELNATFPGAFVQKVYQTGTNLISFKLHRTDWTGWLVFSSRPELPCLFVSPDRPDKARGDETAFREPPPLCRILRRDLEGGRVHEVAQVNRDRIIEIRVRGRDEERKLVFEIIGRFANFLLLTGQAKIETCLRNEPRRRIQPGSDYAPPANRGKIPFDSDESPRVIDEIVSACPLTDEAEYLDELSRKICSRVSGISPVIARECVHRTLAHGKAAGRALQDLVQEANARGGPVYVYRNEGGTCCLVSPILMEHLRGRLEVDEAPCFLRAMEVWYREVEQEWETDRLRTRLLQALREKERRLQRDHRAAARDLADGEKESEFRLKGEMILAHMNAVAKGMKKVELQNLYDPDSATLNISLDPLLNPQENANRYFEKAGKARRKRERARQRKDLLEGELAFARSLIADVESSGTFDDLRASEQKVERLLGPLPPATKRAAAKEGKPDPLRRIARTFDVSEGYIVYVARGAKEGDVLLRRFARGSDLWLHTRDVPGSHVVIRRAQKEEEIPEQTLLDAAHLAAHFSKARGETVVPLHLTEVKNLRRPRAGPPGKVTISRDRTFTVRVEQDRLDRLLERKVTRPQNRLNQPER